mgnify:CR=1 FL=1
MYIVIGVLSIAILIFICILVNYKRQIKDICRQLRFLQEHESNMLITKEMQWGHIGELTELLNEMLKERKKERTAYRKKEQMIADTKREDVISYGRQVVWNQIWRNFCVSDTYEPGSPSKILTVASGLEEGVLKGN